VTEANDDGFAAYRAALRRNLLATRLIVVISLAGTAYMLRYLPKPIDAQVVSLRSLHGKAWRCELQLATASGTESIDARGEVCPVLRPGLHITKPAWSQWIGGGSTRVSIIDWFGFSLVFGTAIFFLIFGPWFARDRRPPEMR
jgi:hypothetical protein